VYLRLRHAYRPLKVRPDTYGFVYDQLPPGRCAPTVKRRPPGFPSLSRADQFYLDVIRYIGPCSGPQSIFADLFELTNSGACYTAYSNTTYTKPVQH